MRQSRSVYLFSYIPRGCRLKAQTWEDRILTTAEPKFVIHETDCSATSRWIEGRSDAASGHSADGVAANGCGVSHRSRCEVLSMVWRLAEDCGDNRRSWAALAI